MNLLVKPKKNSQEIVSVTPESAGWRYVSFSAHQLIPGEILSFYDNSNELCVVVLTGIVSLRPSSPSCSALYTSTHLTLISIAHSRHLCSIHPGIYDTKLDSAFLELLENFRRNSSICNC
jgi:hypothetical protein